MKTFTGLLLLILFAFLAGCASKPCPPPGQTNLSDRVCSYKLELAEDLDPATNKVKAKVPESVLRENIEAGKKQGQSRDYSKYPRDTVYAFTLSSQDMKALIDEGKKKGDEIVFHRKPMKRSVSYDNSLVRGDGREDHMKRGDGTVK